MKKNILLTSSFFWLTGFVYSNTYVWEDYDDFSGSSLDTSKWGTMYLGGGIEPHVTDGKLVLSGGVSNPSASKVVKTGWTEIIKGDDGGQSWIYAKDTEVYGIEAEFIIPNAASSKSGLQLGIASLNPLSYATVELNAEPNSASQYSQGFGFYHLLNGSETENFGSTQRDIAHKLGASLIDGRLKLFVDGEVKYEADSETFNTDMFFLNGFNDYQAQGLAFELNTDNVRVLRQASTTSLDGSIFSLSSTDGVSETMSFENGTFTSSFVDSQKITTITSNQSYILDSMTSNSWKITLSDGDVYSFDSSTGTGTLTDYENGVIDTSGSFNFTYIRNTWMDYDDFSDNLLDTSKWTATSGYFVGNQPTEANGRIELSGLTSQYSNTFLLFKDSEGIDGVEADIWLPGDAPVDTGVLIGIADAGTPVGYLDLWAGSAQTHFSISLDNSSTGESIDLTRNAELGKMYKVAIIKGEQKTALYLDGEKVAEVSTWQSNNLDIIFRGVNDAGSSFTAYLDNVRVLRNWEDYDDFSSGTLDASKWDISYYGGGKPPAVENGVVKLSGTSKANFNEFKIGSDFLTNYSNAESDLSVSGPHSNVGIANANLEGIEFEVMIPSSVPSETGVGLYVLNTQELGNALDSAARANATKAHLDLWYSSGNPQIGLGISGESTLYIPTKFNVYYRLGILFGNSTTSFFVDGEKKAEFTGTFSKDYLLLRGTNENDVSFDTYLDNVRVLRRSTTTTEPDPVTVVSDLNGQAVVVQVGDEYKWSSTLDGVTLWGVEQSGDGWSSMTMRFENGRNFGNEGFFDSIAQPQPYDVPYEIDENGYIKSLEDDGDYQYYNAVSVENGVIGTIQNDEGVDSVANNGINQVDQWFFTTRAAAEEYYYSKVNPKDWMWFDNYPWVYSNEMQEWLYFYPSGSKLLYYSNKKQTWREFSQ